MADCPLCRLSPETINHVFCCSHQEAIDARLKQQEALWKQLSSINTPPLVLLHLQQGIQGHLDGSIRLANMSTVSSQTSSSPSTSSSTALDPALALVLSASAQQSELGWDQLLRGRLSALWGGAVVHTLLAQHQWTYKRIWAAKAVKAFLDYSLSLWKHRCALVHGRTLEESKSLTLQRLTLKVTEAYQIYQEDPHIIPQRDRHIFSVSLEQRLRQDIDSLECFLSTFQIASETQRQNHLALSKWAHTFFQPKAQVTTHPLPVPLDGGSHTQSISLYRTSTDLTERQSIGSLGSSSHLGLSFSDLSDTDDEDSLTTVSLASHAKAVVCNL
jgi:hypothetical protein